MKFPKNKDMFYQIMESWVKKWKILKEKNPDEYKKLLKTLNMNDGQAMTGKNIKMLRVATNLHSLLEKMNELNL